MFSLNLVKSGTHSVNETDLLLSLTLATKHAANISSSALRSRPHRVAGALRILCDRVDNSRRLAAIGAVCVLATALGAVDTLLANHVAQGLQHAAFADLSGGEVVHAVLKRINLFDAGDLGLVELACSLNQHLN